MKKIFKSLMAAALALVVVTNVGGMVAKAEEEVAPCPPHGSYYDEEIGANFYNYEHRVKVEHKIPNDVGGEDYLSDIIGKDYYKICYVSYYEVYVNVRCTKCNEKIGSYYYQPKPEVHSVCVCDDMNE